MKSKHLVGSYFLELKDRFMEIVLTHYKRDRKEPLPNSELLFNDDICKHYYITDSVLNAVASIDKKSVEDLSWIYFQLEDGTRQWSWKKSMMRFVKQGERLILLYMSNTKIDPRTEVKGQIGLDYVIIDYDLQTGTAVHFEGSHARFLYEEASRIFFQLLVFILLAPIESHVVPPRHKHGTRKSADQFLNEEIVPITVININWNRISVRTEGFEVKGKSGIGFIRKQPCGPGRKDTEWKWIEPFRKHGYVRAAKKQNDSV